MEVAGRPAHVANAPPLCPKVMVVEVKRMVVGKKGGNGRPAKLWPLLSLTFHHPPHLCHTQFSKAKLNAYLYVCQDQFHT
jgi:hypothetical protein